MIPLIVAGIALGAFATAMAVYLFRRMRGDRLEELRRRLLGGRDDAEALLRAGQGHATSRLGLWLKESGLGWHLRPFVGQVVLASFTGLLLGAVTGGVTYALFFGLLGAAVLPVVVMHRRRKRLHQIDAQLPQALQIVMLALRAGQAFPGAVALAARETPEPLKGELKQAVEEHNLGSPMGEVMQRLAGRLHSDVAYNLALAVNVLEHTGGDLIAVIRRIVENARSRTLYKARLRAVTAQGRWSAAMLGLMPPGFVVLAGSLDPTYWSTLLGSRGGFAILGVMTTLWLVGLLWTYRLVTKEA